MVGKSGGAESELDSLLNPPHPLFNRTDSVSREALKGKRRMKVITTEEYVRLMALHGRELVDWPDVALINAEQAKEIVAASPLEYSAAGVRAAILFTKGRGDFAVAAALCQKWQYRWAGRAYK